MRSEMNGPMRFRAPIAEDISLLSASIREVFVNYDIPRDLPSLTLVINLASI